MLSIMSMTAYEQEHNSSSSSASAQKPQQSQKALIDWLTVNLLQEETLSCAFKLPLLWASGLPW